MSSELVNWISIIGSFLSLLGVIIAVWQIYKTRRAAEIARDASLQTQTAISRNLLLSDVSVCAKFTEEIRLYLNNEDYVSAQLRASDLNSQLIQIKEVLENSSQSYSIDFEEIFQILKIIKSDVRKRIEGKFVKINRSRLNNQLDVISNSLNKLLGKIKIDIEKEK